MTRIETEDVLHGGYAMPTSRVIPLFLTICVGLALGPVARGYLRVRRSQFGDITAGTCDGALLGLLLLAAFTTGRSLAYILLGFGS